MSNMPAVIVRKGGFLSALFHGVFGFLTVLVVCASGLGFYGLHVVNSRAGDLFTLAGEVVSGLPQWQQNLPPLLAEALDDRRAPEYRAEISVSVKMVPAPDDSHREVAIVEVANKGSETISVLALNVVLEDENNVPVRENRVYAATPIAVDEAGWRGPLFPDTTRRFTVCRCGHETGLQPTYQVAELRIWNGPRTPEAGAAASAEPAAPVSETVAAR
jgi:hypothetical protein